MENDPVRALEREKLRQWVVKKVSGYVKINNVVFEVARKTGWTWDASQQFVREIQEDYQKEIKIRRFPILALGGFSIFFIGLYIFWPAFESALPVLILLERGADFNTAFSYIAGAVSGYYIVIRMFTGLGVMIGGGIGVGQAIATIW
jgi:hypothetical protein